MELKDQILQGHKEIDDQEEEFDQAMKISGELVRQF